jgi:hypothetical protein
MSGKSWRFNSIAFSATTSEFKYGKTFPHLFHLQLLLDIETQFNYPNLSMFKHLSHSPALFQMVAIWTTKYFGMWGSFSSSGRVKERERKRERKRKRETTASSSVFIEFVSLLIRTFWSLFKLSFQRQSLNIRGFKRVQPKFHSCPIYILLYYNSAQFIVVIRHNILPFQTARMRKAKL